MPSALSTPQEVVDEVLRPADEQDDVDPAAIRETLERRGIVGGQVASPERAENNPFIQQVMADAERASASPEEAPNGTGEDPFPYAVGDTVRLQTVKKRPRGATFLDKRRSGTGLLFLTFVCRCMLNITPLFFMRLCQKTASYPLPRYQCPQYRSFQPVPSPHWDLKTPGGWGRDGYSSRQDTKAPAGQ